MSSEPYERWSFRKANYELHSLITNKLSQELAPPDFNCVDEAYRGFGNVIFAVEKISTPYSRRNNYRPCWDEECEHLHLVVLQAEQNEATNTAAPSFLNLAKNEKVAGLTLSTSSTSRASVG